MRDGDDITWRDGWDFDRAITLLESLAKREERGGNYSDAAQLYDIIKWMEEASEHYDA